MKHQLEKMTCRQLSAVYDALSAAQSAMVSIANQPRCSGDHDAGALFIEDMIEELAGKIDTVAMAAKARTDAVGQDAYDRSILLIKHEIACGSGLPDIAALATEAVAIPADRERLGLP